MARTDNRLTNQTATARGPIGEQARVEAFAGQLSALGNPIRLSILRLVVRAGPDGMAAGDIQAHVDVPASTLSHHLKRLSDARLVTRRNEATFAYYAADYEALRTLTDYVWEDCCRNGSGCC